GIVLAVAWFGADLALVLVTGHPYAHYVLMLVPSAAFAASTLFDLELLGRAPRLGETRRDLWSTRGPRVDVARSVAVGSRHAGADPCRDAAGGLVGTHRGPRSGPVGARGGGEVGAGHDPRTFSRPHDVPWQSSRRGAPVDVSPQVAVRRGTLGGRVLARAARAA